ncbi:MAG: acetylornithine transaminase [Nocardioides sp.]|nr:acetylornithine transaminase [Nocardioides sp.]
MTWQERYSGHLVNAFGLPRLELVRGSGSQVWDSEGRVYLDLLGGIAVNSLGHAHPAVVDAVHTQLTTLGHVSNFFTSEPQIQLAERLGALVGHPTKVFFSNSGTEANEAALKLTRLTGRTHVVATEGAFHGRTMGALSLTHKPAYREPFEPLPGEVTFVPYGDADALAAAVTDETAAVVLEPIQGEAGVLVPPAGYLAAARQATSDHGALLWLDEVQTGIGRTGAWFAHQLPWADGVVPDVVTLAKGLGGGMPIGATLALGSAAELFQPGNHGTTFGGNPVSCAAALAVLSTIESEGLLEHATTVGAQLRAGLEEHPQVVSTSGAGLLVGVDLGADISAAVTAAAQAAGFIVNNPTPSRLRLAPALTLTRQEAQDFVDAWPTILEAAGVSS